MRLTGYVMLFAISRRSRNPTCIHRLECHGFNVVLHYIVGFSDNKYIGQHSVGIIVVNLNPVDKVVKELEKRDIRFNLSDDAPVYKQPVTAFLTILEPINHTFTIPTGIADKQR